MDKIIAKSALVESARNIAGRRLNDAAAIENFVQTDWVEACEAAGLMVRRFSCFEVPPPHSVRDQLIGMPFEAGTVVNWGGRKIVVQLNLSPDRERGKPIPDGTAVMQLALVDAASIDLEA